MEITIRGDKLKITDSMKSYIDDKLGKLFHDNRRSIKHFVAGGKTY